MMNHAHVEAALFTLVITALALGAKWVFGWVWPAVALPLMILGTYIVLRIVFTIVWNRR